jgi:hypothetical protein
MHCTILIVIILCIYGRLRKAEDENPSGAGPMGVGGPQATSCEDANIVVTKASPSTLANAHCLLF